MTGGENFEATDKRNMLMIVTTLMIIGGSSLAVAWTFSSEVLFLTAFSLSCASIGLLMVWTHIFWGKS